AAELVAVVLAAQCQKQRAGLPRIHVRVPRGGAALVAPRAPHHDVGAAIAVEVADSGRMTPEALIASRGVHLLQHAPVASRVDARDAGAGGAAGDDVGNAVVIGVPGSFDSGAELIPGRTVCAPQQPVAAGGVDIDPAGTAFAVSGGRGDDIID